MSDLVAFLRARLDERERGIRQAIATEEWGVGEYDLADVEAKRRILDEYEKAVDRRRRHPDDLASAGALLQMVSVVKLLSLPYADHEDYREEWRLPERERSADSQLTHGPVVDLVRSGVLAGGRYWD